VPDTQLLVVYRVCVEAKALFVVLGIIEHEEEIIGDILI
jgi:hypothetical protein